MLVVVAGWWWVKWERCQSPLPFNSVQAQFNSDNSGFIFSVGSTPSWSFCYLSRDPFLILWWSEDQRNAQVLYCNCNTLWNNRMTLEVSCGVWLNCVDEHCIIHEVICNIHFCCIFMVNCGPTRRKNLNRVRNFLLDYFLLISCIRSPRRICYFCLNACFSGFFCS